MSEIPDCLVLCIEEFESIIKSDETLDTRLFIIYDTMLDEFVIRGKRTASQSQVRNGVFFQPYSFNCKKEKQLKQFITFVASLKQSRVDITIYNYDNLPLNSEDITYEFLESNMDQSYEIAGYDYVTSKSQITKAIKIIKNINNEY